MVFNGWKSPLRVAFILFLGQCMIVSVVSNSIGKWRNCSSDGNIISGANINSFKDCIEINGNIQIKTESFQDMHPSSLEIFETVRTITGFLNIEAVHADFKNLSFFRNLELIHGLTPGGLYFTLNIDSTSLESLDLLSLKQMKGIGAAISYNERLCYTNTIKWNRIVHTDGHAVVVGNREVNDCAMDGKICDPQCSEEGCWGAGADRCISCRNYQQGSKCVEKCADSEGSSECLNACPLNMFEDNGKCANCHDQCIGCTGPSAKQCTHCTVWRWVRTLSKYPLLGECLSCPKDCTFGCTSSENRVVCNRCSKASHRQGRIFCKNSCPIDYFQSSNTNNGTISCSLCHEECAECNGPGNGGCLSCKNKKFIYDDIRHFKCTSNLNDLSECIKDSTDASTYFCAHMNSPKLRFTTNVIISII